MESSRVQASQFSWQRFTTSLIYENLPPVFASPIAALLIERSFVRAWNVCQHRGLMVLSTRYNPLPFILFSWLVIYPGSWLVTLGMVTVVLSDASTLRGRHLTTIETNEAKASSSSRRQRRAAMVLLALCLCSFSD